MLQNDSSFVPCRVTYIWIASSDSQPDIRSKDRTLYLSCCKLDMRPKDLLEEGFFPSWNFDGSSTGQSHGLNTEIVLKPVNAYPCFIPRHFMGTPWFVVVAECYLPNGLPTKDNSRALASSVFNKNLKECPWFGMEQEFFLMKDNHPYGWDSCHIPPQGYYYCGTGSRFARGRKYIDLHYEVCLKMGLNICGTNAEVAVGQWEFQIGPCEGIEMGDQLNVARWVLLRILEADGLYAEFGAKPIPGDWNGSGLHTNFSTASTREFNGIITLYEYCERLKLTASRDIIFYGCDNNLRLTGEHETSNLSAFSYGVGTRGTSIRIPNSVASDGKGYMEDRRPAAAADPYLVSARLFASCMSIDSPEFDSISDIHKKDWMNFYVKLPISTD
ncbi:Glutamine synthetase catalytic domain [Trypanosoma vivax]|uniref:glutamine synthetase n=1 Tax=Trypanosoma vivax (strain Y486) TaxID=1055687 RepID=G0TYX5_TRYVY|nr:putative glutamine synthetase [Trypanosoma vivax]KAH8613046.1 Glutamine synthetase catalytic domain [Trypanosoma vivax]CCC49178.1 putative glutamine synthetase [Trypanosoma vivax Y486]